jgi:hypothetical protein
MPIYRYVDTASVSTYRFFRRRVFRRRRAGGSLPADRRDRS